jgi:hypothetical protein
MCDLNDIVVFARVVEKANYEGGFSLSALMCWALIR